MKHLSREAVIPNLDQHPATLSANVYCDHHFHDVLRQVVAPLSQELKTLKDPRTILWFSRYSRCGQHLKLRLHTADETSWSTLRSRIITLAENFFATLPETSADALPRTSNPRLPPIDKEDELDGDYPDRSILWTRFQPSPRTVGNERYLADNRLLNLFYLCMGANTKLLLDEILASDEEPPLKAKQAQLLRTVVAGLCALDLSPQEQISYIEFHRDWHLRYLLSQSSQTKADETIERLNQKLDGMDATVTALSSIIASQISHAAEHDSEEDEFTDLRTALRTFFDYTRGFRGRPEYDLDPYTSDFTFLPLFKVLHGFANQIGVPVVNELYTYHILLRAVEHTHSATFADRNAASDE